MRSSGTEGTFEDRCTGCLLGTACGDILGAAVEGWSAAEIRERFGEIRDFLPSSRGFGCYTDDTQMTVALAASLVERGRVDAAHVSAKYAEFYQRWRGYGGAAILAVDPPRRMWHDM
jgi:poly(ADP-ribose) glycohydrolase ARH3